MFKVGNIVRCVDHPDNILTVTAIDLNTKGVLNINTEDASGNAEWFSADDLELVTEQLEELEESRTPDLVMSRTIEQLYVDIGILFTQVTQYYQMQDISKNLYLSVKSSTNSGAEGVTVAYRASLGGGDDIVTRSLHDSVRIACAREKEDKLLKPLEIAFK